MYDKYSRPLAAQLVGHVKQNRWITFHGFIEHVSTVVELKITLFPFLQVHLMALSLGFRTILLHDLWCDRSKYSIRSEVSPPSLAFAWWSVFRGQTEDGGPHDPCQPISNTTGANTCDIFNKPEFLHLWGPILAALLWTSTATFGMVESCFFCFFLSQFTTTLESGPSLRAADNHAALEACRICALKVPVVQPAGSDQSFKCLGVRGCLHTATDS